MLYDFYNDNYVDKYFNGISVIVDDNSKWYLRVLVVIYFVGVLLL